MLLISFVALQTPYVSIMIFNSYATAAWPMDCEHLTLRRTIGTLSRLVPHLHCLINPILYALLGHDFLQRMRQCFRGQLLDRRAFLRSQQNQRATAETNLAAGNNSQSVATSLDTSSKTAISTPNAACLSIFPAVRGKAARKPRPTTHPQKIPIDSHNRIITSAGYELSCYFIQKAPEPVAISPHIRYTSPDLSSRYTDFARLRTPTANRVA